MRQVLTAKLEFIKTNFPEIATIDPYRDFGFINKVKRSLIENGFYKQDYTSIDETVLRLVLKAQGRSTAPIQRVNPKKIGDRKI